MQQDNKNNPVWVVLVWARLKRRRAGFPPLLGLETAQSAPVLDLVLLKNNVLRQSLGPAVHLREDPNGFAPRDDQLHPAHVAGESSSDHVAEAAIGHVDDLVQPGWTLLGGKSFCHENEPLFCLRREKLIGHILPKNQLMVKVKVDNKNYPFLGSFGRRTRIKFTSSGAPRATRPSSAGDQLPHRLPRDHLAAVLGDEVVRLVHEPPPVRVGGRLPELLVGGVPELVHLPPEVDPLDLEPLAEARIVHLLRLELQAEHRLRSLLTVHEGARNLADDHDANLGISH